MTKQFTTFSPVDGGLYSGDLSSEDFRYAESFYEDKLATLVASDKSMMSTSNIKTPDDFLKASVDYMAYKIHLEPQVEATVDQLIAAKKSKQILRQMAAGVMSNPAKYMQMLQASQQLSAAVDDDRVAHIRTIPRLPKIIGAPPSIHFIIKGLFSPVPMEKLDGRQSIQGSLGMELQKNPGSKTSHDETEFQEETFHLKRNTAKLLWTGESQRRSDADLKGIDYRNAQIAKDRARDAMALWTLSKTETVADLTINDPKASGTNDGAPRAKFNPLEDIAEIIAEFNVNKSADITGMLWNSVDFTTLLSNYFLKGHNPQAAYMGYGMFTLPQLPNQLQVVSPLCPRGYVYGVDQQAAIVAEGPMVLEEEREADIFSNVAYPHDFVEPRLVKPKRFGIKIELGGVAASKKGKEITSLAMAQALAKPKSQRINPLLLYFYFFT
ncbi:MAG: hypothetical protein HRU07_06675 [Nitrosopumilus sp.]|nr:hypothetical protein [Nitrosopumilus sp.]NRA05825.1 hypothetical protein [Nitrosopumilus sp.]